jgi:hypothetical protein
MIPADIIGQARVTLVGSMTTMEKALCKKLYGVRLARTRATMKFICETNRTSIARNVQIRLITFPEDAVIIDRTDDSTDPIDHDARRRILDDDIAHNTLGSVPDNADDRTATSEARVIVRPTHPNCSGRR